MLPVPLCEKHIVHYYRNDEVLCRAVAEYVKTALADECAVIAITEKSHRQMLEAWLAEIGVDFPALTASDRLILLDADETLTKFMRNGQPDRALFEEVIGQVIDRASQNGRFRVRAYGEMVNLLWERGQTVQALILEDFWNGLIPNRIFRLLCAYQMQDLADPSGARLAPICAAHTHSTSLEGYPLTTGKSIIVAEDDEDDYGFIEEAFQEHCPGVRLVKTPDGEKLFPLVKETRPALVILDLNMPRKDGRQSLVEIRGDSTLDRIPIIVLTTSTMKADERYVDCFKNAYFVSKPTRSADYAEFVRSVAIRHLPLAD